MTRFSQRAALSGAAVVLGLGAWLGLAAGAAHAQTTLRVVPQADLKNLDTVWTTAAITANHAYMVYDTLFALDEDLQPQPQMVGDWSVSDDGLTYSFTLRDGLKFHDGSPVEAKDAVASIKRWSAKRADGMAMMDRAESLEAVDEKTFVLKLKEKFGPTLTVLGNPTLPLPVMREEEAMTDPNTQVTEMIGSGPFVFAKDEWVPGSKVVYTKFEDYVPRDEPASGFAGGKVAKVDRVEWIYIPDTNTATQALMSGEV
ncbi:MAG TPA: ABC transporter substrate-binding protein, partial [Geminicoccaceae bacterium]|nr:ABC transporter substrate-binding protein [Geminicoccaceae bacterium]